MIVKLFSKYFRRGSGMERKKPKIIGDSDKNSDVMEDSEILDLYWVRSETALSETEKKYGRYCNSIAYRILNDMEDAEECVNDTWLRAWKSIPPKRPNILSVFLGKIVRNLSLNRYEKQKAKKRGGGEIPVILDELEECIPSNMDVEQTVDAKQLTNLLNQFLASIPEEKRRLFVQRYWYLRPVKEIAKIQNINESRLKMRLFRIRQQLKEMLESQGYDIQ